MNDLTPLNRPVQSQVKIDPVAKQCPSDGFEYPTFRQLNKHARIYLSKPLEPSASTPYNFFDVANSKGWFVAVKHSSSGSDLIFSTLESLRSSFSSAKDSSDELFTPKRTVTTPSRANIVRFAAQDSRLLVAQDNGSLLLFDASQLFTEDQQEVHPLTSTHIQTTYLRQIVPNPGTEPGLSNLIAVVSNGKVLLFDTQLEQQGGWAATDLMSQPIAVSWSPKGKHIAIGLQTGDILTFSLTNKTTPHKHIPPTADGILASLNWLAPGHTFRTSYAAQGDTSPQQHVIVLDTKTSTATYYAPDHPFPSGDRNFQSAYVLNFPKWDTTSPSNEENKFLTVVADASSTDVEVLGNIGNSWFRQMQENPLQLPLDNNMDDTMILALESDLTDSTASAPIMYAYLNDGSLQGWHLEHSKPYLGIITPNASGAPSSAGQVTAQVQDSGKDADMGAEQMQPSNAFAQQGTNAFGQSSFAQPAFGSQQTSAFGQTGFGQKSPQETAAFGQTSFGQPPAFSSTSAFGSTNAFGQPSNQAQTSSPFASAQPAPGFGAFGGSNNAFGSSSNAFGSATSGAFGSLSSGGGNVFGQGSFGSSIQTANEPQPESTVITREASMSDSTPSLGGFGLGSATPSDPNARNSMFGSFSTTPSTTTTTDQSSAFGNGPLVKPATGFGAFGNYKPSSTFEAPKPAPSTTSVFDTSPQPATSSGFGQSGFASPAFGKSAFGQPAFGQPAFGKPSLGAPSTTTSTTPTSGGFGAFANAPTTFGSAASTSTTAPSSGGFSAFASAPTSFGAALSSTATPETKPATGGGFSAFANTGPSAFGTTSTTASKAPSSGNAFASYASETPSAFGSAAQSAETAKESPKETPATSTSPFAPSTPAADTTARTSIFGAAKSAFAPAASPSASPSVFATPPRSSIFANIDEGSPEHASPPSSPEPIKSPPPSASFTPSSAPNVFSNLQTTPSAFKPATGFGAFGSFGGPNPSSPFYKKPTEIPTTSALALESSPKTPTTVAAAPTFGSTSALGASKSAFAPVTPPVATPTKSATTNAFSAFAGASSSFSSYVPNKTSFSDLLKTGGEEAMEPSKSPALPLAGSERVSVFGTPSMPPKKDTAPISVFAPVSKANEDEKKSLSDGKKPVADETSYGSLSTSSTSSSFVDVSRDEKEEGEYSEEEHPSDEDAEHSDNESINSFLSEEEEFAGEGEENELPDIDEEEEEEEEEGEESAETPVAPSRSPSPTPQPETPSIKVSPSLDDEEQPAEARAPQERERSATPPATPVKEPAALPAPSPTTPVASSAFGIGLGRPSTRPARSSPLANAISRSDDEEEEKKLAAPIPVSPKAPVEVLPVKLEEMEETSLKRPKTPPLLSVLGRKSPTPSTPLPPAAPDFKTSPAPAPSVKSEVPVSGGLEALATAAASSSSIFGTFSIPQAGTSRAATATTPSIFGIKSPTLPPMPSFGGLPSAAPAQQQGSLFGATKQIPKTPTLPTFGGLPSTSKPSPPFALTAGSPLTPKTQVAPSAASSPGSPDQKAVSALEDGMQKECMRLVFSMQSDFKQTSALSQAAQKTVADIKIQLGGSRLRADLGNKEKWTLNDLDQFKQLLKLYEADLDLLEADREKDQQMLREIESNMLKAGTRREEIARFNKAKDDKEFAKMLRSRTLGPEYSETQAQLRKSIRNIRDRIQKLETHLVADKKKLAQSTSCKPSFRAPSLDTINRTYRNIEIAIDQQSSEVARLASRIGKLDIKDATTPSRGRDSRLPDQGTRHYDVTPNVAAVTAAALNAERSAARLKSALLAVRSEPLLNTKVATAPSAPVSFVTPNKEPFSGPSLFSETLALEPIPDWDLPPDNFDPSGSPSPSVHRGAAKVKKHQPFKRNITLGTTPAAVPAPPGFEWGPLPSFSAPPPQPAFSFASFMQKQNS